MKTLAYTLILSIALISCGETTETTSKETTIETTGNESTASVEENESNTNKWVANSTTYDAMNIMNQIIKGFWDTEKEDRNYAYLSEELSYQCDYMIQNCTMKGEDHEQLHVILEPMLGLIDKIKNAPSYEEADQNIQSFEAQLQLFFEKFEVEQVPS